MFLTQKILIAISVLAVVFETYSTIMGFCVVLREYALIFAAIILASMRPPKIKWLYILSILILVFWFVHEVQEFLLRIVCTGRSLWIPLTSLLIILIGSDFNEKTMRKMWQKIQGSSRFGTSY